MRRQSLKAPELYAVRGIDRRTVPALVLDTAMWDLQPGTPTVFTLSPPDARHPKILDPATGARRGVLTLLPSLDAPANEAKVLAMLRRVQKAARKIDLAAGGEEAFGVLRAEFDGQPLLLDTIRATRIISPWPKPSTAPKPLCPVCGEQIETDASSRIRAHPNRTGVACVRNGTKLTPEERSEPSRPTEGEA